MGSGENKQHVFTCMDKNGSRLTFVEKKKNLFFLIERVIDEVLIDTCTIENGDAPMVSNR